MFGLKVCECQFVVSTLEFALASFKLLNENRRGRRSKNEAIDELK